MRRRHIIHHTDGVRKIDDRRPNRNPVKNRKLRSKPLKIAVFAAAVLLVSAVAYEAYSFFKAANNALGSNITLNDIKNMVSASKGTLKETDGKTNILILGKGGENHPGGQLTDTIQVAMINQTDKKVAMVSLPRDLQFKYPDGQVNKLNYAYFLGYDKEKDKTKKAEAGAKSSSDAISKILGVPIHYYITVDFVGFKELVDSLGGVTVNVEKSLYDPYYPKDIFTKDGGYKKTDDYTTVSIKAGKQEMDGETALKYARSRETTSDFDRAHRQQELLLAVKEKALSVGVLSNPKTVSDMFSSLGNHIKTNLGLTEIKEVFELVGGLDKANVASKVVDNNEKDGLLYSTSEGGYYLLPKGGNYNQIQKMVKNIFASDSDQTVVSSIEVYNASGVTGQGGVVAQLLKDKGLTIDKIDTYSKQLSESKIVDGTSNAETLKTITNAIGNVSVDKSGTKGTIQVIIGKNYGN